MDKQDTGVLFLANDILEINFKLQHNDIREYLSARQIPFAMIIAPQSTMDMFKLVLDIFKKQERLVFVYTGNQQYTLLATDANVVDLVHFSDLYKLLTEKFEVEYIRCININEIKKTTF